MYSYVTKRIHYDTCIMRSTAKTDKSRININHCYILISPSNDKIGLQTKGNTPNTCIPYSPAYDGIVASIGFALIIFYLYWRINLSKR